MDARNVILTGVPRSGTTLTCHLLNKLDDTVALHEPMRVRRLTRLGGHKPMCRAVRDFFETTRRSLRKDGTAPSKQVEGRIPDNPIGGRVSPSGPRQALATWGVIKTDKPLSKDFVLCVKHPIAFTAILAGLQKEFQCYAVVRNPLPVLASWNSVDFPVTEGRIPVAERLKLDLAGRLEKIADPIERQLCVLDWFFATYDAVLPPECIIRYEELVASGGAALGVIRREACRLSEKLESQNRNPVYDRQLMPVLAEALLASEGAYWKFYSKDSVRELLRN